MIITENGRGTEIVMRKDSRISGRLGTNVSEVDLSKFWFMWDHTPLPLSFGGSPPSPPPLLYYPYYVLLPYFFDLTI